MGLRRDLAALLTAPLATLLEARVRELTLQRVEHRGLVGPADVRTLAGHLDRTNRALAELASEIETARQDLESLRTQRGDAPPSRSEDVGSVSSSVHALTAAVVDLRDGIAASEARVEAAQTLANQVAHAATEATARLSDVVKAVERPKPEAVAVATPRACRVPDCDGKHRARKLCGRHYMMWRRNNLPGFVLRNGTVFFQEDGPRYEVDPSWAGRAVELVGNDIVPLD